MFGAALGNPWMSGTNIFLELTQFPEPTHCYGAHTRFSTGEVAAKLVACSKKECCLGQMLQPNSLEAQAAMEIQEKGSWSERSMA